MVGLDVHYKYKGLKFGYIKKYYNGQDTYCWNREHWDVFY